MDWEVIVTVSSAYVRACKAERNTACCRQFGFPHLVLHVTGHLVTLAFLSLVPRWLKSELINCSTLDTRFFGQIAISTFDDRFLAMSCSPGILLSVLILIHVSLGHAWFSCPCSDVALCPPNPGRGN